MMRKKGSIGKEQRAFLLSSSQEASLTGIFLFSRYTMRDMFI